MRFVAHLVTWDQSTATEGVRTAMACAGATMGRLTMWRGSARRRTVLAMLGWCVALGPAAGCNRAAGEAPVRTGAAADAEGTRAMARELAALYADAVARPGSNLFANRLRADSIAANLARSGNAGADVEGRFLLAQERILAGQTREGITILESLAQQLGISVHTLNAQSKPLLDLLAIANLRLGEQENCAAGTAANACILPLDGGARHLKPEGARKAVALYTAMGRAFPQDLGSRWLLNVAWMALGGYPDSVPPAMRIAGLDQRKRADFPVYRNVAGALGIDAMSNAGGVAIDDFDGDGLLDLFVTAWGLRDPVRLYIADGHGGYTDRAPLTGLDGITGGLNVSHADYDNDGRPDVFVMRGAWLGGPGGHPNSLLRNLGGGRFADVTIGAGLLSKHPTPTAAWADFDLDGWLDLFVGNESGIATGQGSHPSELWLNNRDGTFSNVAARVGVDVDAFVKGATWGDVNNDGLPDLYLSILNAPNKLYVNRGGRWPGGWRFEERAVAAGVDRPLASFATWFWDVDQDGWDDLFVASYDIGAGQALHDGVAAEYLRQPMRVETSRLFINNRDGTFRDASRAAGLDTKAIFAMGANFGDLDNDGWLDAYLGTGNPDLRSIIPNRMLRNVGGTRFEEVSIAGGFAHLQKGHAVAFADLDGDGDEDIYTVMGGAYEGDIFANVLFENPGWANTWVTLQLEGRTANRSAFGARVRVVTRDAQGARRVQHRTVGTGGSFGSNPLALHMGLGAAIAIDSVVVTWPDAARLNTTYTGIEPKAIWRLVQGEPAVRIARGAVPFATASGRTLGAPMQHPPDPH